MSLMGTLGKVAMGVIVAKGVGKLMNGGASNNSSGGMGGILGSLAGGSSGGMGGLLGSLASSAMGGSSSAGGLGGLLGSLTGGGQQQQGGLGGLLGGLTGGAGGSSAGGLGGLLGGLTGGAGGSSAGGLGGLLGGLAGQGGSGGLGGLLNSLGGGAQNSSAAGGGFGDLFNTALQGKEPEVTASDEKTAELMLRAMISAAKADGKIDENEQKIITEHLGDISADEANFVRKEMQAPLDLAGLIASVPAGMEKQVYLMSMLAITLDNSQEAAYLDKLAQGLNISQQACNDIHDQLGAPKLYS